MHDEKRVHWSNDPVSREIDAQVRDMPDRPQFVLAVVSYDISQDARNRAALEPFLPQRFRESPLVVLGAKLTVGYYGFEPSEASIMAEFIKRLEAVDFDECLIYIDGDPALHTRALDKTEKA